MEINGRVVASHYCVEKDREARGLKIGDDEEYSHTTPPHTRKTPIDRALFRKESERIRVSMNP